MSLVYTRMHNLWKCNICKRKLSSVVWVTVGLYCFRAFASAVYLRVVYGGYYIGPYYIHDGTPCTKSQNDWLFLSVTPWTKSTNFGSRNLSGLYGLSERDAIWYICRGGVAVHQCQDWWTSAQGAPWDVKILKGVKLFVSAFHGEGHLFV